MYIKRCQPLNRRRSGKGPHGDSCRENPLREMKTNPLPLEWQVAERSPDLPSRLWQGRHGRLSRFDYGRPYSRRKMQHRGLLGARATPSASSELPRRPEQSPSHLCSGDTSLGPAIITALRRFPQQLEAEHKQVSLWCEVNLSGWVGTWRPVRTIRESIGSQEQE
ncbi:hypothetical protein E1301_Tti015812 [Triplophysa tibetana]|uniref:Uncharacterized protein n=1 Tax=Triplophysa tibetana TaxID=1572043 RepID=A0A5A9P2S6_9TELE|nr:hypothetical protein E1301_Tti015812 [Triplophysa tibetana]